MRKEGLENLISLSKWGHRKKMKVIHLISLKTHGRTWNARYIKYKYSQDRKVKAQKDDAEGRMLNTKIDLTESEYQDRLGFAKYWYKHNPEVDLININERELYPL